MNYNYIMTMLRDACGALYGVMWPKMWIEESFQLESLLRRGRLSTNSASGHSFHGGAFCLKITRKTPDRWRHLRSLLEEPVDFIFWYQGGGGETHPKQGDQNVQVRENTKSPESVAHLYSSESTRMEYSTWDQPKY